MLRKTSPADLQLIPKDQMSSVTKIPDGFVFQYLITSGRYVHVHKKVPENKRQPDQKKDHTMHLVTDEPITQVLSLSDSMLLARRRDGIVHAYFVNEIRDALYVDRFALNKVVLKFPDHFYTYDRKTGETFCVTIDKNNGVEVFPTMQPRGTRYFPHSQNPFALFMTEVVLEDNRDYCNTQLMLSEVNEDKSFSQVKQVDEQAWFKIDSQYHTVDVLSTELGFVRHQHNSVNRCQTQYHRLDWYDLEDLEGNPKATWSDEKSQDIGHRHSMDWCTVTHHDQTFIFAACSQQMYVWQMVVEGEKYSFDFRVFTFPYSIHSFAIDAENERMLMTSSDARDQLVVMEGFEPLVAARRTQQLLNTPLPPVLSQLVMEFLGHKKPLTEAKAAVANYNDLEAVAFVLFEILKSPELNSFIEPIPQNHSAKFKPNPAKQQLFKLLENHDESIQMFDMNQLFEIIWNILEKNKLIQKICERLHKKVDKRVIIPFLNFEEVMKLDSDVRLYGMLLLLRQMHDLKKLGIEPEYPLGEMLLNWLPYLYRYDYNEHRYFKAVEKIEAAFAEQFQKDSVHQAEMSGR